MEYMSQEGFDKIASELQHLERVELPRVRDAISEARDKGDLSENFEYHAAKREQGRVQGSTPTPSGNTTIHSVHICQRV